MQAYVQLLVELGGDDLVQSMRNEVRFRVNQGAEWAEALSEHYEHTRKKYAQAFLNTSGKSVEPESKLA